MRRFRRSILLRLSVAGLLLSLGVGAAAPVAAAGRPDGAAERLGLDEIPETALDEALAAVDASADTPEAFADALAGELRTRFGDAAPAADALLGALYGQLFRVLQEKMGDHAVILAATSGGALLAGLDGEVVPGTDPAPAAQAATAGAARQTPLPAPRTLRPALQPLGP